MKTTTLPWALLSFAILALSSYLVLRDVALLLEYDFKDTLDAPILLFIRAQPAITSAILSLLFHIPILLLEPHIGKRIFIRILGPLFALFIAWSLIGAKADIVRIVQQNRNDHQINNER